VHGPKYGFGTQARSLEKKDGSPGPGHYKVPVKVADVPKYSLPSNKYGEEFKYV